MSDVFVRVSELTLSLANQGRTTFTANTPPQHSPRIPKSTPTQGNSSPSLMHVGYEAKGDATTDFLFGKDGKKLEECWVQAPYAGMMHDIAIIKLPFRLRDGVHGSWVMGKDLPEDNDLCDMHEVTEESGRSLAVLLLLEMGRVTAVRIQMDGLEGLQDLRRIRIVLYSEVYRKLRFDAN